MAKVLFKRVNDSSELSNIDIEDGSFIVTGDGKSFIDYGQDRLPTNGTPDTIMSDYSSNSVENKVVKKYIDDKIQDVDFTIYIDGEWTIKKYNNGYVEMWHKHVSNYNITEQYGNSATYYSTSEIFDFPLSLDEMISINTSIGTSGRLVSYNYTTSGSILSRYQLYIYTFGTSASNQSVLIYTCVVGKWKED